MNARPSKWVVIFGFFLGTTFLLVALRGADLRGIWQTLMSADFRFVVPFLAILGMYYWIRSVRWSVLLKPLREGTKGRDVFPAVMIGFSSAVVVPPPLSDFVRMYVAGRQLEIKNTSVFASIVLERIFDVLTIVVILGVSLLIAPKPADHFAVVAYMGGLLAVVVLAGIIAYAVWTEQLLALSRRIFKIFPERAGRFLLTQAEMVASGLMALKSARSMLVVAVLSVLQWGLMGLVMYISLLAVHVSIPISASYLVLAITFTGVALPSTPGAIGTVQLAFALALGAYGLSSGEAVAASIFWHVTVNTSVLMVGLVCFLRLGYSLTEIRQGVKKVGVDEPV